MATRLQKAGTLLAVLKRNAGMLLDLSCLLQLQNGNPYPVISLISFLCVCVCCMSSFSSPTHHNHNSLNKLVQQRPHNLFLFLSAFIIVQNPSFTCIKSKYGASKRRRRRQVNFVNISFHMFMLVRGVSICKLCFTQLFKNGRCRCFVWHVFSQSYT